jgi:putative flippase GtrA
MKFRTGPAATTERKRQLHDIACTVSPSSPLLSAIASEELIKYMCLGAFAFTVDAGLLLLLVRAHVHYIVANTLSFLIANCINFAVGHFYVFGQRTSRRGLFATYLAVLAISLIGLLLNDGVMVICVDWLMLSIVSSKILATLVGLLWNFLARKTFVYR